VPACGWPALRRQRRARIIILKEGRNSYQYKSIRSLRRRRSFFCILRLAEAFALCSEGVRRSLICRPLNEPECGDAFRRRAADFRRLSAIYEYGLPSLLPSGRETFHAKVVLGDASAFYVGSSNFMGSPWIARLSAG
jgi:hypothetical protein